MIQFDPTKHVYSKNGIVYKSVTTLIKEYCNPFDAEFMSTYKAVKDVLLSKKGEDYWKGYKRAAGGWKEVPRYFRAMGHTLEIEILARKEWYIAEWTKIGRIASERGTQVHEDREKQIKGKTHVTKTIQGNCLILEVSQDQVLPMQDFYSDKVYTEVIVCNDEYGIAGMVDLAEKFGKVVHLSDYKTYKEVTLEGFDNQMLKEPLQHIPDCKYQHAQLQLSLYAWMFEKLGYNPGSLTMLHLHGIDCKEETRYPLSYKKQEIEAMLNHHKSQNANN